MRESNRRTLSQVDGDRGAGNLELNTLSSKERSFDCSSGDTKMTIFLVYPPQRPVLVYQRTGSLGRSDVIIYTLCAYGK